MNTQITTYSAQLPDTLSELSKFALVGREKLAAVRAEINAIKKVGLAKEVLEQKKAEAQEIAELVTLSEVRIGAMLKEIPKATANNNPSGLSKEATQNQCGMNLGKQKSETVKELGFTRNQVSEFQRMAEHEAIVLEAIAEARENDDIISRSAVLKKIEETKKPHVAFNSGNNEWYTPKDFIESARNAMGSIDLDPASSDIAQETVMAKTYYTAETNGLDKTWNGNVWMNPPYSSELIIQFVDKLVEQLQNIDQAVVLVNNATETEWFGKLVKHSSAVCFPKSRVKFYMPDGKTGAPLQGQAVLYFGDSKERFIDAFYEKGWCAVPE